MNKIQFLTAFSALAYLIYHLLTSNSGRIKILSFAISWRK